MSPIFALITVFLEFLESLHIFAIFLAVSFQLVAQERVWCLHFLNSRLPLVSGLVLCILTKIDCL